MDSTVSLLSQNKADLTSHIMTHLTVKPSNLPLVLDCLEEGLETLPQQEQEEDRPQPHEDGEADPPGGEQKYPCSSSSHLSDAVAFSRRSEKPQWFYYSQLTIDLLPEAWQEKAMKVPLSNHLTLDQSTTEVNFLYKQKEI